MPSSELGKTTFAFKSWNCRVKRKIEFIAILIVVLLGVIFFLVYKKRKLQKEESLKVSAESVCLTKTENEDLELPLFDFKRIANATSDFSQNKKLGEGGFGRVYNVIIVINHTK
ncbi:hypothetical protein POM88_006264 [Heracleum sosnowskyi]|uniref:Uncharacterized protein n=1 Tax=Heracleum sosnowskyi TaxID=360622 RepID=A0AAD8J552_9APIA|nr:hypothetical protein POM88_006264 [Heracleum sosnowskyi]